MRDQSIDRVMMAAGCAERGCVLTTTEELFRYPIVKVLHEGKNPEAYREFDRYVAHNLPERVVDWLKEVHAYEDERHADPD